MANTLTLASDALGMSGSNNYTISGLGSLTAATTGTLLTVNQVGTGTLSINSLINPAGAGGLTKAGSGTLVIGAANTFTGAVNVAGGLLQLGPSSSVAAPLGTSSLTTQFGATFDINGNSQTFGTLNNSGTITSSSNSSGLTTFTFGSASVSSASGTFAGAMNVVFNSTASAAATTLSGAFANTGNVTINNTLPSANTTGVVTLSGPITNVGNLILNMNTTLTAAGGNLMILSGSVNNSGSITSSGGNTGAGGSNFVEITGLIGSNVTSVNENSTSATTSQLLLANPANAFTGGLNLMAGVIRSTGFTNSGVVTPYGAAGSPINLGNNVSASGSANLYADNNAAITIANPIFTVADPNDPTGTNVTGIVGITVPGFTDQIESATNGPMVTYTGPVTLAHSLSIDAATNSTIAFTGGFTGVGSPTFLGSSTNGTGAPSRYRPRHQHGRHDQQPCE